MGVKKLQIDGRLHPDRKLLAKKFVMVLGSRYVPLIIKAAGERAEKGDLEAAEFLFEFLGLVEKPAKRHTV